MLQITENEINLNFSAPFDAEKYDLFVKSKKLPEYPLRYDWETDTYRLTAPARYAHLFGLEDPGMDRGFLPMADHLFDYQKFITETALKIRRYAVWADTGLGKTAILLEYARQVQHRTGGKVLIISPLNIIQQTVDESIKFYRGEFPEIAELKKRDTLKSWLKNGSGDIGITNPEKFIPRKGEPETVSEMQHLNGVVLDEASILKSGGGTIKWALIKSCRGIEYKLTCTATPAPNDTMEYASQGSFLEKLRSEGEILWTFFCRDKNGEWKVKDHAHDAFYRFMSGWSVYLRNPVNYGFADNLKNLPKPEIHEYFLDLTDAQKNRIQEASAAGTGQISLFPTVTRKMGITDRNYYSQLAKGFYYGPGRKPVSIASVKPGFIADLAQHEVSAGHQVLIWTVFDAESDILKERMEENGMEPMCLSGKTPQKKRADIIEKFRRGKTEVLISKASMLGYGVNFQNVTSMIFSGLDDSFERFYQAVRRAYRYGQTQAVRIHLPLIRELEGIVYDNILKKQEQFISDTAIMERNYRAVMAEATPDNAGAM